MKKNILYIIIGIFTLGLLPSCDLENNINPKKATQVDAGNLLAAGQIQLVLQYAQCNVNYNISRLLCQHWSQTTYVTESRYDFADRDIPGTFAREFYRDVLIDLKEANTILDSREYTDSQMPELNNKKAIIEVLNVLSYTILVETFGDMPYSEALMALENPLPKYDDAIEIYKDLFKRLDAAIALFDTKAASFGSNDVFFGGDVAKWKQFAQALIIRMSMRAADIEDKFETKPSDYFKKYYKEVGFKATEALTYVPPGSDPWVNPINEAFVIDARNDFVPSNTLMDKMNDLEDPRRALWFTQKGGKYVGLEYGLSSGKPYGNYSHFTPKFIDPKLPVILSDYVEMQFFFAEAAERGWTTDVAADHYNNAITASIKYWGGSDADVAIYLANPKVAYATAVGDYRQKIGTQKWIAMYDRGVEAWTEWRRLDYPKFNLPEPVTGGTEYTYESIPKRYPYSSTEATLNPDAYAAAVAKLGGNESTIKLWFDVK
ncbi:MAG: SusD/RagB family nutrient-binding outer membrane lipoprotein [Marinifilaceae bacterium]|jgi:hypothetical protein|nr:SusD/RagB family nutrient-binding outer membrane lipoprotein [Marinifilaceae bacterium]